MSQSITASQATKSEAGFEVGLVLPGDEACELPALLICQCQHPVAFQQIDLRI